MVARKKSAAPTQLWKYGGRVVPAADNLDLAWDLIRASNSYYNELLGLHARYLESYRAIREQHAPQLRELKEDYEAVRERVESLRERKKAARSARDRDLAKTLGEQLKQATEERRAASHAERVERLRVEGEIAAARAEMVARIEAACGPSTQRTAGPRVVERVTREVRETMWGEPEWPELWVALDRAEAERGAARKRARAACGLPSGCYTLIEGAVQTAINKSRPQLPHERRFDRPTRIGVQVTGTVTWRDVVHGRCPRVRVEPATRDYVTTRDGRVRELVGREHTRRVGIRVSTRPDEYVWATMHLHREPDPDAVVKWAWLRVERKGRDLVACVQFTIEHASLAEPRRPPGTGHVTIVPCCTLHPDGIAVALWSGDDGESGAIVVPRKPTGTSRRTRHALLARLVYGEAWSSAIDAIHATALHILDPGTDARTLPARRELERLVRYYCEQRWGRERLGELWRQWRADREELIDRPRHGDDLETWWPEATAAWVRATLPGATEADVLAWWGWTFVQQTHHALRGRSEIRNKAIRQRDELFRREAIRLATRYETATVDKPKIATENRKRDTRDPALREVLHLVGVARCGEMVREQFRGRYQDGARGELQTDDGKALRDIVDGAARESGQRRRAHRRRPERERSGSAGSPGGARSGSGGAGSAAGVVQTGPAE